MDRMQSALHELTEMDELAMLSSPVHSLHAAAKLIVTAAYIVTTLSFDKYDFSGLVPMLLWPVLLFSISGIRIRSCFYKLRIVLPLVMAAGIFNPFFDHTVLMRISGITVTGGFVSMLTLMMKGVFCLMASFLLMATTPIDRLCAALRGFHLPGLLITLLLLTYRYAGLMTGELAVMTQAYHLRAPGQKGIHISAWGSFLGQLLLRSMDRSKELYESMLLRGYNQEFHYADDRRFQCRDAGYLIGAVLLFLLLRFVPVAQLLGGAFLSNSPVQSFRRIDARW